MLTAADQSVSAIPPLVENKFTTREGITFTAACFEGKEWSLAPLQKAEDAGIHAAFALKLGTALSGLGAKRVYSPNPTKFNGEIIQPEILERTILLPGLHWTVHLYRNQGVPADGTFLVKAGDAGIFSAGGCGKIIAAYGKKLLMAHAGRECLIDRREVLTLGKERSRSQDLVENMFDALEVPASRLHLVQVWPLYFIKPENFVHRFDDPDPDHAEYNRCTGKHFPLVFGSHFGTQDGSGVCIDLPRIARFQFMQRGVLSENIHMEHAYLADELPTTRNGGGRYLVATVRLS